MDAEQRAAIEINGQKEELSKIVGESPLYLDRSFLERENFLRYLVAVMLH